MKKRIMIKLNDDNINKTFIDAFIRKKITIATLKIIENTFFKNLNAFI